MRCALGLAVTVLIWNTSVLSRAATHGSSESPHAVTLGLTLLEQATVRRAVALAIARLARPDCSRVYEDFRLTNGESPRTELDRLGLRPEHLLDRLVFVDGGRDPVCRIGRAVLTTSPGNRVIRVCPAFASFQLRDPHRASILIIHESLHALGLSENPPTSNEITLRVAHRCW